MRAQEIKNQYNQYWDVKLDNFTLPTPTKKNGQVEQLLNLWKNQSSQARNSQSNGRHSV